MRIANLSQYKEKKGLSGRELAQELGISESYLSEVLSGQRTISKKLALKISEQTGIPVLNLLYPREILVDASRPELLTEAEVVALTRRDKKFWYRQRCARKIPFSKLGRKVLYRLSDVEAFVAERSFGHRSIPSSPASTQVRTSDVN